jgi:hypothetical protein
VFDETTKNALAREAKAYEDMKSECVTLVCLGGLPGAGN